MGRRPELDLHQRQRLFLRAVANHPWARTPFLAGVSGLRPFELRAAARLAVAGQLVERTVVPGLAGASARYGLTPAGASPIGATWSRARLGQALLRALSLDAART